MEDVPLPEGEVEEDNQYVRVNIDDLKPYDKNPRLNAEAVPFTANSIRDYGYRSPIIVTEDMVVVAGHTRLEALKKRGRTTARVLVCHDMTADQAKGYRLSDNKTSEYSAWDTELLLEELSDLDGVFDMSDVGFFTELIEEDEGEEYESAEEGSPGNGQSDLGDDIPKTSQANRDTWVKKGDIIVMGRHRLICGDATNPEDLEKLMNGRTADVAFTSPPYNVSKMNTDRARDSGKYAADADDMSDEDYTRLLEDSLDLMLEYSYEQFINIGVVKGSKIAITNLLHDFQDSFKDLLYWKKSNPVPALAKNHISSSVELIIAFGQDGSRSFRKDPGYFGGVFEGTVNGNNEFKDIHRAVMPEYLPADLLDKFTEEDALVLDPFAGCGTTLMACEENDRTCYMVEIEPLYCQTIVERYIDRTGSGIDITIIRDGAEIPYTEMI